MQLLCELNLAWKELKIMFQHLEDKTARTADDRSCLTYWFWRLVTNDLFNLFDVGFVQRWTTTPLCIVYASFLLKFLKQISGIFVNRRLFPFLQFSSDNGNWFQLRHQKHDFNACSISILQKNVSMLSKRDGCFCTSYVREIPLLRIWAMLNHEGAFSGDDSSVC